MSCVCSWLSIIAANPCVRLTDVHHCFRGRFFAAVSRQSLVLVLSVASIVFLSAGMFHLFETELWELFEGDIQRPDGDVTYGDSLCKPPTLDPCGYLGLTSLPPQTLF